MKVSSALCSGCWAWGPEEAGNADSMYWPVLAPSSKDLLVQLNVGYTFSTLTASGSRI